MCIVKLPERDYWCDDVQAMTKRIFGVYALDRRQHFYLCEMCASYELWFIESQYEDTDDVAEDEDQRNELNEMILAGDDRPNRSATCTARTSTRSSSVAAAAVPVGCRRTTGAADTGCVACGPSPGTA